MHYALRAGWAALAACALSTQAWAQTSPAAHDWYRGTTLNVFAGAGVDAGDTSPLAGGSVGWDLWPNLAIEGSGYWLDREAGASAFAAALKAQLWFSAPRPAVPFVSAGVGLYRLAAGAGPSATATSTDPSFVFGGGINIYLTRQIALRPDVEIMLVRDSPRRTVGAAMLRLVYHFEDRPITPARRRR
jgi:hypothetical protein